MFCSKCGNEISEHAVICPKCGCATGKATAEQLENHPVIKTSYGQLFISCMLGGLAFGVFMGILFANTWSFIGAFLVCALAFGLLMFAAMAICGSILEKTSRKNILKKVAMNGKIYLEGSANRSGNGGWLFVTQNAIEHHVHSTNFDTTPSILPHDNIVEIHKSGRKLVVVTNQKTYTFVVNNVNQWINLLSQCELTKNKIHL